MARHAEGFARALGFVTLGMLVLVGGATTGVVLANRHSTTSTLVAVSAPAASGRETAQAGWAVATSSGRGVMVDIKMVTVGAARFRVVRLRSRSTLLRWHVGLGDPALYAKAPADAGPAVDWSSEGRAGVVAVFNGGFKQAAKAGGSMADGFTFVAPTRGLATIALDAGGHWAMGVWGAPNFPPPGFHPISFRQNLPPLVRAGAPTPAASGPVLAWGSPLGNVAPEPRTGLGVDAAGNLVFVATMDHVLPIQLARALVAAGAVIGMQLDINPYWPVLGVPTTPLHRPGRYAIGLVGANHSPNVYDTGWIRDFFVAVAEPSSFTCSWASAGLRPGAVPQAQRLRLVGRCASPTSSAPTSSAPTSTVGTTSTSAP
ncbi:MAG: hypothetical protein KGJ36_03635 [Acidobacteriota bacterium]|nr:hypothetical protein [Acidobacteriota bacterium]